MTLLQMSYILEVDRCGSMNRAAQNLFLSQSALSAAIAEVEALLRCEAYRYGSAIGIVPYFLRAGHAITAASERISHE